MLSSARLLPERSLLHVGLNLRLGFGIRLDEEKSGDYLADGDIDESSSMTDSKNSLEVADCRSDG